MVDYYKLSGEDAPRVVWCEHAVYVKESYKMRERHVVWFKRAVSSLMQE
jgi:hypothetical protein